ncbi:Protein of unknown function [Pseudoxanthobacter soli DSM 19599]|uniref:DUF1674 domain-containing protein n=1 Tax=Pseudoxanthobacter soli DSM 19599 TaxID=1123029 RepID=A0A1M7ZM33_9HYPH|nr:DUF1674 domain-containing protein [Pseudoxanthobacter soli]SHO65973.1 Protein of unknown function [Pseudoxanthobacter soli DSM 19599]
MTEDDSTQPQPRDPATLPEAAKRALAEAEARRASAASDAQALPREINGRDGPEPVRFGDWEVKGIACDF